jgi:hypothetical protein
MTETKKLIFSLSEQLHKNAFDIVFSPIKFVLNGLSKSNVSRLFSLIFFSHYLNLKLDLE